MKKVLGIFLVLTCLFCTKAFANNITLIGVNDTYIPYSTDNSAIYFRDSYYVPYTVFTNNLDINAINQSDTLMLYGLSTVVNIDKVSGKVINDDNYSYIGLNTIKMYYVNVPMICELFSLNYSVTKSNYTTLRITSKSTTISDNVFSIYAETNYKNSLTPTTLPTTPPTVAPEIPSDTETSEVTLQSYSPIFLESVSSYNINLFSGTLFLNRESFNDKDMIREAFVNDFNFGIYINSDDDFIDVLSEINDINSLLFDVLGIKTELLYLKNTKVSADLFTNFGYVLKSASHTNLTSSNLSNYTHIYVLISSNSVGKNISNFANAYNLTQRQLSLFQ